MSLIKIVFLCLVFCVLLGSCSKKKKEAMEQAFTSVKTDTTATSTSDDIFDEFYDDTQPKKSQKPKDADLSSPSRLQFNPEGRYVVQLSCVLSKSLAQEVASKLQSKGYPTYIAEVENPTPDLIGTYQRIRIGGFDGISQAKAFGEDYLLAEGYEYWVDNKSNDNVGMGGSGLGESSGSGYQNSYDARPATPEQPRQTGSGSSSSASEWGSSNESSTTPSQTPAVQTPPAVQQQPATQPAQQPVQQPAQPAQPAKAKPQQEGASDWDKATDEWGSDTSGW